MTGLHMIEVSVIICTRNRADSLARALNSFNHCQIPTAVNWELLVVDNNSTDHTEATVRAFQDKLPLRSVFEPLQGINHARNRGLAEAKGELLLFTDDDVEVDKQWLSALWQAARHDPEAVFLGGRIQPRYEAAPPRWFRDNAATVLSAVAVQFDLGEIERRLTPDDRHLFYGANMAFRSEVFRTGLRFPVSTASGTDGRTLRIRRDETQLLEELRARGCVGRYVPQAVIYHWLTAERLTRAYVRHWFEVDGIACVELGHVPVRWRCAGVPLKIWWQFAYNHLRYVMLRWITPSRVWLRPETKRAAARGMIQAFRQRANT